MRSDLALLDRDRARALQGQYQATSCPICLDEFQKKRIRRSNGKKNDGEGQPLLLSNQNGDDEEELVGSDGKALKLLPCGHAFDQTCWDDFSSHPSMGQSTGGGLRCPICREPTDEGSASRTVQSPMNDLAYQEERRFRLERLQELYPTFIGTQYIDQWYDPDYRGSLLEDYTTMEEEQRRAADQAAAEHNRMFSIDSNDSGLNTFGGGKADGDGVGDSWKYFEKAACFYKRLCTVTNVPHMAVEAYVTIELSYRTPISLIIVCMLQWGTGFLWGWEYQSCI